MLSRPVVLAIVLSLGLVSAGCSGTASQATPLPVPAVPAAPPATSEQLVQTAVTEYKAYASGQVDELVAKTKTFTDAVRAGDLAAARAAYAPSREPWERIEPIAGLVEVIDGKVDARVDDFAGVDDPAFTGWHRLELLLFERGTTEGGKPFADQLDADLATLKSEFPALQIPAVNVPTGAAELIEEVSQGKITGEEDRYSKTDLWDLNANLQGSQDAIRMLTPALQQADPELLNKINVGFTELNATLAPLREGNGWKPFCQQDDKFASPICPGVTVPRTTIDTMKAQLAGLSENVSQVAGALRLT